MLNNVSIMGRLTKDPEVKNTPSGVAVCSFTIACDRNFKDSNGEKKTDFIDCVAWRNTATFIGQYFHKGQLIILTGEIQKCEYEDRNGNKRYVTEVIVSSANFAGDSTERQQTPEEALPIPPAQPVQVETEAVEVDEGALPFDLGLF